MAAQAESGNLGGSERQAQLEVQRFLEVEAGQRCQRARPLPDRQKVQIVRQVKRAEADQQPTLDVVDALAEQRAASQRLVAPARADRRPLILVELHPAALK